MRRQPDKEHIGWAFDTRPVHVRPQDLIRYVPHIRVQDPQERDFDGKNPLITQGMSFAVWEHKGEWYLIIVPDEFQTDGASIPRPLWPLVHPLQLGRIAWLVHDYVIKRQGDVKTYKWDEASRQWVEAIGAIWSRWGADLLFFRLLSDEMKSWPLPTATHNDGWLKINLVLILRWWKPRIRTIRRRAAYLAVRAWVQTKTMAGGSEW